MFLLILGVALWWAAHLFKRLAPRGQRTWAGSCLADRARDVCVTTFDVSRTEIVNEDGRVSAAVQC
ncbi:MAG TPA: hypothetical protein PLL33_08840, partial [Paracoccus sp. (in: a-proteobacteria)]|nr:hypothetical protein [Paracoccus sp. (in: a-proteobacteria)]